MDGRNRRRGEVTVRRARPHDAPALARLARDAYAEFVPRIGREPAPMTSDYHQVVRAGDTWTAVSRDGELVGFLVLVPAADHLLIENVAVAPDRRGKGIGTLLLGLAEEWAKVAGLREVRLYTNEAMTDNLTYYARRGYTETHRGDSNGYRRVFFAKALPQPGE